VTGPARARPARDVTKSFDEIVTSGGGGGDRQTPGGLGTRAAGAGMMAGLAPDFPNAAWLEALRARASDPSFADARAALDERVDQYHRLLPDIPVRQAGYYHDYFCPDHAVQLAFDPRDPHRHACPMDGRVFSGEPFDSAWGWSVNDALSDAALRTAVRWVLGGAADPRGGPRGRRGPDEPRPAGDPPPSVPPAADADLVRRILLGYASRYRAMPMAPKPYPGPYAGIACWSALDESVFIIRLAWAAALLRPEWTAAETAEIRTGLLEPAFDHLRRVRYRHIQNVASWDNSANLTLAWVLGDEAAIDDLLDGEFGVRDQLTRGVGADGLWWEGSLSYHYYVLGALAWTIRGLRAAGRTFLHESTVRAMFRAPLDLAFPDGSLPAMNDCWYRISLVGEVGHGIPTADGFHELAHGWFGDPAFAWVLDSNRRAGPRRTFEALLEGASTEPPASTGSEARRPGVPGGSIVLPRPRTPRRPSRAFEPTGFAVLRVGRTPERQTVAILKAGGDGDAHGHADQLGLQLFAAGQRMALDPGTPGYGIALNDSWYRQTAAHSTVLLDSRSQPPARARMEPVRVLSFRDGRAGDGTARAHLAGAEVSWPPLSDWAAVTERARASAWTDGASEAYADVRLRRWLLLTDGYLVDAFMVEAPGPRTIDWLHHQRGRHPGLTRPAPGVLAGTCGYDEARDVRRVEIGPSLRWSLDAAALDLWLPPDAEERLLATVPGNPAADTHDLLVRRHTAPRTFFVAVFAPWGRRPVVRDVAWQAAGEGWVASISTPRGVARWTIDEAGIRPAAEDR